MFSIVYRVSSAAKCRIALYSDSILSSLVAPIYFASLNIIFVSLIQCHRLHLCSTSHGLVHSNAMMISKEWFIVIQRCGRLAVDHSEAWLGAKKVFETNFFSSGSVFLPPIFFFALYQLFCFKSNLKDSLITFSFSFWTSRKK